MKKYNFQDLILSAETDVEYYKCDEVDEEIQRFEAIGKIREEYINELIIKKGRLEEKNKKLIEDFQKGLDLIGKDEPTCQEWNEGWKILRQVLKDGKS